MSELVDKSFYELFNKDIEKKTVIKYSRAFKGYNANVKYTKEYMEFHLAYSWKEVSEDIKIGLIQSLLNKIHKTSIKTLNIEFYEIFLKKIPTLSKKTESDPILEDSFKRMNAMYFSDMMLQPNLVFGGDNFRTMGTYNYNEDTIMISSLLKKDLLLLDYVMYHEMLHKKLRGEKRGKRMVHHSREFRELERKFHDPLIEEKLKGFVRKERFKMSWF